MLDKIATTGWGQAPLPLLPASLRRLWGSERLPIWMADELRLSRTATYGDLDRGIWERIQTVSPRILTVLSTLLRARLGQAAPLRLLECESWPDGIRLSSASLSVRSVNALHIAGLLDRPEKLMQMTFDDLIQVDRVGTRSTLEIACTMEWLLQGHLRITGEIANLVSPEAPAPEWTTQLADSATKPWADSVSERDPRFVELLPKGEGTIAERIDRYLAEPTSVASVVDGRKLAAVIDQIEQEVERIEGQSLEESLHDLLQSGSKRRHNQVEALLPRFGWNGNPPKTLEAAAQSLGLTRERVRQIEERFLAKLPVQVFLPKLDAAVEALEKAAPIPVKRAQQLLIEKGICTRPFAIESVVRTARILHRQTDIAIEELRDSSRVVVASSSSGTARLVAKVARRIAGAAGVASTFQVAAALRDSANASNPDETRRILSGLNNIEFLNEDWFWIVDLPVRRNRLSNLAKKILSVASPQSTASIREGVRRAFLFRSKSKAGLEWLTAPPADVIAAFFKQSPEFKVHEGQVNSIQPLSYLNELGDVDRAFVEVLRSTATGVLDRRSLVEACLGRGLNENTISVSLTYSAVMEHVGIDAWKLRGVRIDPAAIEALREANAAAPVERRVLSFGWRPDGRLWIACRVPYTTASFVVNLPSSIRRYLADQRFSAYDRASQCSCGQITINDAGTSFGYSIFFRLAGADPGDVLLGEFDLGRSRVELSLADDAILEAEDLVE